MAEAATDPEAGAASLAAAPPDDEAEAEAALLVDSLAEAAIESVEAEAAFLVDSLSAIEALEGGEAAVAPAEAVALEAAGLAGGADFEVVVCSCLAFLRATSRATGAAWGVLERLPEGKSCTGTLGR